MSLDEKWSKDKKPIQPVKNDSLTCRTCKHKTDAVVSCDVFEIKPVPVLKGGVCSEYKKI